MKKRLLTILLIFCMVLTMIPVGGVFADSTVITEGDITYTCTTDGSNNTATVTRCNTNASGENGEIKIPSSVTHEGTTYKVTGIGKNAFSNCTGLKSIKIPNSVTTIGKSAFYGCAELTGITFVDGSQLTSIGDCTFYECEKLGSLGSIEIPNNVTSIGEYAFYSCTGLTSITFASNSKLQSIGKRAFWACRSLTSIEIPNGVETISAYTFSGCEKLERITFADGSQIKNIGEKAFDGCKGLTSITIPDSVTSIAGDAFYGCSKLDNINIGQNSNFCFDNEGKVLFNKDKTMLVAYLHSGANSSYIIPESVISIGANAFSGCKDLTSITIPNSVTVIGVGAFSGCKKLESIIFAAGSKRTSIGTGAFSGCSALKSIEIPNSVTSIGKEAFSGCSSLTSITFAAGSQLESIGDEAFFECYKLTFVIYGDNAHNNNALTSNFPKGIFFETKPEFGVNNITSNSVTLNKITGATDASKNPLTVEYRVKDEKWNDTPIFEGLNPDTEYIFQVRFVVNENTELAVYELAPVRTTPSYTPPANPTIDITAKEGGTVIYDRIKHTVTITPNDDYLVKEITINGTTVPVTDGAMVLENIYGWSRISVTFEPKPEPAFEPDKYISELKFKASSSKTSKGNIRIKVTSVTDDNGNKIDLTELKDKGYTVKFKYYRSTKKASKYTAKVEKDADINSYINTVGKKGTKYYYKVRVMVYDADGNLVAKSDLKQCSYAARTWSK